MQLLDRNGNPTFCIARRAKNLEEIAGRNGCEVGRKRESHDGGALGGALGDGVGLWPAASISRAREREREKSRREDGHRGGLPLLKRDAS